MTEATTATNSGVAPFNIPVTLLDTCCSANGNTVSGTANHTSDNTTMFGQAFFGTGCRAFGIMLSVMHPNSTRIGVIKPGANESSPISMK